MIRFRKAKRAAPPADESVQRFNVGVPEREILGLTDHQMYPEGSLKRTDLIIRSEPGLVTRQTPIASMGSCFAAELKKWLVAQRYNYVQTETGPGSEHGSARFGFVYNTACLRQIIENAFGRFTPQQRWWVHAGKLLDPYRKSVAWADESAAQTDLENHATAVRAMVHKARVLVLTAGLIEVWRNKADGATFFQVPPRDIFDPEMHEFVRIGVRENTENLHHMYAMIKEHNPDLRLIVTLSPVPLRATFQKDITCVEADAVSKATLRVAISEFCEAHPEVIYFPAYEIVKRLVAKPFKADNRHVRPPVIDRIMQTFIRHYGPSPDPV